MHTKPVKPLVTAVIPAHNGERYLAAAIESVLAQTYTNVECIVVDDGSTDGTGTVAEAYADRIRSIRQDQRGVSAARNRGAVEAGGELLAFLDADDRWLPERIEHQVRELDDGDELEAVVCETQVVDHALKPVRVVHQAPNLTVKDLLFCRESLVSVSSNLVITRQAFDEIGGFDEQLSTSADWKFMYELVARGRLAVVPERLVEYRLHDQNMSSSIERFDRDMFRAFDQVFAPATRRPAVAPLKRRAYANLHRMVAGAYWVEGDRAQFLRHTWKAITTDPSMIPYFLAMPVRRVRRRRQT